MLPLKKVYIQSLSELINFFRNIFFKLYTFPGTNINQLHQTDGKVQESLTIICISQLPVQSKSITTKVVSSNPAHGEVYSIQHYEIKFVNDL
jgi:hypothetical protein